MRVGAFGGLKQCPVSPAEGLTSFTRQIGEFGA